MSREQHVRLVFPHQLFLEHLDAPAGTLFVLVEDDLFFRQYRFHVQKLILHRASMRRFAQRLREASFDVEVVETAADAPTGERPTALLRELRELRPTRVSVFDVVDDWLDGDLRRAVSDAQLDTVAVLESPNFLTTSRELGDWFGSHPPACSTSTRGSGSASTSSCTATKRSACSGRSTRTTARSCRASTPCLPSGGPSGTPRSTPRSPG